MNDEVKKIKGKLTCEKGWKFARETEATRARSGRDDSARFTDFSDMKHSVFERDCFASWDFFVL